MQHAIGSRPDPAHGYCTDDVARALQVDLLHQRELGWAAVAASAWRNLAFLAEAFCPPTGRFRNFRAVDGSWLDARGSEDCQGRAMHRPRRDDPPGRRTRAWSRRPACSSSGPCRRRAS